MSGQNDLLKELICNYWSCEFKLKLDLSYCNGNLSSMYKSINKYITKLQKQKIFLIGHLLDKDKLMSELMKVVKIVEHG